MKSSKLNCTQANEIDLVNYLSKMGYHPSLVRGEDYWYISPFRNEHTASFKINQSKNVWYDHGIGEGGKLINFICILNNCNAKEALEIIKQGTGNISIFHPPTLTSHKENKIQILSIKDQMGDLMLWKYLKQRNIDLYTSNKFCKEVIYQNNERIYSAIGFKNNLGGYELRSEHFKGSSSPKFVSFF